MHLFQASYWYVNYLVDLALLVGAFYGGYQFFERRAKRNGEKKDETLDRKVERSVAKALNNLIPPAVDASLDEQIDGAVAESIQTTFGEIFRKLSYVDSQLRDNGGSSLTDAVKRLENMVNEIRTNQAVTQNILENQQQQIKDTNARQADNVKVLVAQGQLIASHVGEHRNRALDELTAASVPVVSPPISSTVQP